MMYALFLVLICFAAGLTIWRRKVGLMVFALSLALVSCLGGGRRPISPWRGLRPNSRARNRCGGATTTRSSFWEPGPTGRRPRSRRNPRHGLIRDPEGAELYRRCARSDARCRLIVGGGDTLETGDGEADVYARTLIGLGVPNADIIRENRSLNTFQNARNIGDIIAEIKPDKMVLVT